MTFPEHYLLIIKSYTYVNTFGMFSGKSILSETKETPNDWTGQTRKRMEDLYRQEKIGRKFLIKDGQSDKSVLFPYFCTGRKLIALELSPFLSLRSKESKKHASFNVPYPPWSKPTYPYLPSTWDSESLALFRKFKSTPEDTMEFCTSKQ